MEEKEEIITVTGKGNIHVVPDVIRMELSLVSLHDTYQEAYAQGKDISIRRPGRYAHRRKRVPCSSTIATRMLP
ncbi:MAG: SIMPL domain-containing protein [Prevotella sp.]|nr:SIMPL domain-containing protein [Prevotella sp.]